MSEAKSESAESLAGTTPPAKTPPSKTPPSKTPPAEPSKQSVLRRYYPAAVPVILGLIIYFMPVPDGVDPKGMHMLGIFVGTIVALILQPLPDGFCGAGRPVDRHDHPDRDADGSVVRLQ